MRHEGDNPHDFDGITQWKFVNVIVTVDTENHRDSMLHMSLLRTVANWLQMLWDPRWPLQTLVQRIHCCHGLKMASFSATATW